MKLIKLVINNNVMRAYIVQGRSLGPHLWEWVDALEIWQGEATIRL